MDGESSSAGCRENSTVPVGHRSSPTATVVPGGNSTDNITWTQCNVTSGQQVTTATYACHSCDNPCIYKTVELFYFVGVLANFLVVWTVARDRTLRKPTFVAIACLAVCDALFLVSNLTLAAEIVIRSWTCTKGHPSTFIFQASIPMFFHGTTWFAANLHITLLAVVRYIMVVHPLKSNIYLTNRRIIIASVSIWGISAITFLLKYIIEKYRTYNKSKSAEATTAIWLCAYLLPLTVSSILHLVKLKKVRKSSMSHERATSMKSIVLVRRMSRVIIVVIILAAVLPLPRFIYAIMYKTGYQFSSTEARLHFLNIAMLLYFLNSLVNPFIYAFMSASFRNSVRSGCISRCCGNNRERNFAAILTPTVSMTSQNTVDLQKQDDSFENSMTTSASASRCSVVSSA